LGSFYLDIIKDRQYTAQADGIARRSCQTALYHIAEALTRWIAPILSFTADEIWQALPGQRSEFVFTETWYEGLSALAQDSGINDEFWAQLITIRDEVNKSLEQARRDKKIGGTLEAKVTLFVNAELEKVLAQLGDELRFVLLTSDVTLKPLAEAGSDAVETELSNLKVTVEVAEAEKCERCWHHREDVGSNPEHPGLCGRCVTNVAGEGEQRRYA
jgi:isoleucyl-tRNA synthetase